MRDLLNDVTARALAFLEGIDERHVGPDPAAIARLAELDYPLPAGPSDPRAVVAELDGHVDATMGFVGPRFFGFVIGGTLPAALAAGWLATAWDQNAGLYTAAPLVAVLESVALQWLVDLFGLPAESGAGFVTGATMANFTALCAARHAVLERAGWDVERDGMFGAPPVTVIVGEEAHPTLFKSLGLAGFGRGRVVRIPVDGQGRMRPEALPPISGPTIVCIQAGNVNTGAFDPATEIIPYAHAGGAWVHVDGAFGLWAAASPSFRHLMAGYADADSWATDAHKYLNTPYDSGLAFVRDAKALRAAMAITAAYLPATDQREPSDYTPELSRRARGIEVWAALRSLGRAGVADLIDQTCQCARLFADGMRAAGFTILNEVVLNQVLVQFGTPEQTRAIIAAIQADGTLWAGPTVWQGHTALRLSVSSWKTTPTDIERSISAIVRIAREHVKQDDLLDLN
jgi:glutamate/tyrosine decarboxylase-like PLP-dependent enzyme